MNRKHTFPLVSVMVVSYNQSSYIEQALQSILEQDYPNVEIVVSDDASSDGTQDIIRRVAERAGGRVRLLMQPINLGITDNCNVALRACQGDYVAFMGGDDYFLPGKLEKQVAWFQDHEEAVLCGHAVKVVDGCGQPLKSKYGKLGNHASGKGACDMIVGGNPFAAVSVMVRRERIPDYGFDKRLPVVQDWKLWLDIIGMDGEFGYVAETLAAYRRHANNITQRLRWPILRDVLLTAVLTTLQFRGHCLRAWLSYFCRRLFA